MGLPDYDLYDMPDYEEICRDLRVELCTAKTRLAIADRHIADLLEACKAIVRAEKGNVIDFFAAVDAAKEAISKAQDT